MTMGFSTSDDAANTPAERMTGSQAIVRTLEDLGVTDVFGLPGGAILPTYDPLRLQEGPPHPGPPRAGRRPRGSGLRSVQRQDRRLHRNLRPRRNQPADRNRRRKHGLHPLVAITGQVSTKLLGSDAFQEADIVGMAMPISKHSFMITDPQDIPRALAAAFHIASTGRPGPVLVDVTKDAQVGMMEYRGIPEDLELRGYTPVTRGHSKQIHEAAKFITESKRPVFYVGGGLVRAGASEEFHKLAKLIGAPVVTTLNAIGAFPDSDPQNLGMPGMHGTVPAVAAMQKSDLLITLGARFDDRVTGKLDSFAPEAKVIHIDVDPAEISKIRFADVPIVGDLKYVLPELTDLLSTEFADQLPNLTEWWNELNAIRKDYPLGYEKPNDGLGSPEYVLERISALTGPDAYYVTGVGQHQMWGAHYIQQENPATSSAPQAWAPWVTVCPQAWEQGRTPRLHRLGHRR